MGAGAQAFLCEKGHHYADLWDEETRDEAYKGCPCGVKSIFTIPHYGDLNDCYFTKTQVERGLGFRIVRMDVIGGREVPVYNIGQVLAGPSGHEIARCKIPIPDATRTTGA